MPLTDTAIKNVKASDKPQKLFDGGGLFLLVSPEGGKWWRLKYRFRGKEKLLSLGTYPDVALKEARKRRDAHREQLASDVDPGMLRKREKIAQRIAGENSFEKVALLWLDSKSGGDPDKSGRPDKRQMSDATKARIRIRLEREVFPVLGPRPISEIETPEITDLLTKIQSRGVIETAHRCYRDIKRVFRFAVATHRAKSNPAAQVEAVDVLRANVPRHHASVTAPAAIGSLMRAIATYQGHIAARAALRILPYVFVRPGELRHAEWSEFDLEAALWRIPAHRMKMREQHLVPLSRQAIAILKELQPHARGDLVFPSIRSSRRPMSENTLNAALRSLGYTNDQMTSHGFRSMASTMLNELGWAPDAIERQLAHGERDKIRAAYNYSQYLPTRQKMMQAWADHLDALRDGADVVPLHRTA